MKSIIIVINRWKLILIACLFLFFPVMVKAVSLFISRYFTPYTIRNFILSFGSLGAFIFILIVCLQAIVVIFPGDELLLITAGYIYGTIYGTIFTMIGITTGCMIAFFIGKHFEYGLSQRIIPRKMYHKLMPVLNGPYNYLILFIIFLLPEGPKSITSYISGISKIKAKDFLLLITIARLPGTMLYAYIGTNIYSRNYAMAIFIFLIMVLSVYIATIRFGSIVSYSRKTN